LSLRVLAFTPQPEASAAGRYRVFQWREPLRAHGIALDVAPFLDDRAFARLYQSGQVAAKAWDLARLSGALAARLRSAARYDLVLVHRELWPLAGRWPIDRLRGSQPRWVFDFDDAVFLPNVSDANRRFVGLKAHGTAAPLAAGARAVSAGNAFLADWARSQRPGRPAGEVEVIPTVVDSDLWTPAPPPSGPVRLVWLGSPSTARYLAAWQPALARVCARHSEVELHVIGATLSLPDVRTVVHPWSAATERELVQRCHVGLAPLGDGDWERGKCGLKLLLYMALGLPAVASRTGVHPDIVTTGEDGVLVTGDAEIERALAQLIVDPARRTAIGGAARATLERSYSLRAVAPRFATLLCRAREAA